MAPRKIPKLKKEVSSGSTFSNLGLRKLITHGPSRMFSTGSQSDSDGGDESHNYRNEVRERIGRALNNLCLNVFINIFMMCICALYVLIFKWLVYSAEDAQVRFLYLLVT